MSSDFKDLVVKFFNQFSIPEEKIHFQQENNQLKIEIDLDEQLRGIFIGHHASTLDAFQFLLSLMVNNQRDPENRLILTLDIGGYRQERYQRIIAQAEELAEEAIQLGMAKSMPHLSPTERRQVHLYFQDNERVTTYSQGEGENRRLFVAPAL